ncbi:MAG: hypothetical protein AAF726_03765 [Planctomycetota bacterium]
MDDELPDEMVDVEFTKAWVDGIGVDEALVDGGIESVAEQPDHVPSRAFLLGAVWDAFVDQERATRERTVRIHDCARDQILWWAEHEPDKLHPLVLPLHWVQHLSEPARARVAAALDPVASPGSGASLVLAQLARPDLQVEELRPSGDLDAEGLGAFMLTFWLGEGIVQRSTFATMPGNSPLARPRSVLLWFEAALEWTAPPEVRAIVLESACSFAVQSSEYVRARAWATELLDAIGSTEPSWNTANGLFAAHTTLGRIALEEGDGERACAELLSAGRAGGSPQLNSFGPDFDFANRLLQAGHRETVEEFLQLVAGYWTGDRGAVARWRAEIQRGETPNLRRFGADF